MGALEVKVLATEGLAADMAVEAVAATEVTIAAEVRSFVVCHVCGSDWPNADYDNYGGSSGGSGGFRDSSSRKTYEEYDAGDDDVVSTRRSNSLRSPTSPAPRRTNTTESSAPTPVAKAKAPEPAPNLLDFDDDFSAPVAAPPAATITKTLPSAAPAADREYRYSIC